MSDRHDYFPPDEPVIGDPYAGGIGFPSSASTPVINAVDTEEFVIGGDAPGAYDTIDTDEPDEFDQFAVGHPDDSDDEYVIGEDTEPQAAVFAPAPLIGVDDDLVIDEEPTGNRYGAGYAPQFDPDADPYDGSYYDDYDDEVSPARQPVFYIFLGLALLVGGVFIFLLFSLFGGNGEEPSLPTSAFNIVIDQPLANERVATGADLTIAARANGSEPIRKFELFIQDRAVDSIDAQPPADGAPYSASFTWRFSSKGEYTIFVRATSESGATKDSEKVTVVAYESPGDRPVSISGRVVATVSMRTGPGEEYEAVGTLTAGQEVKIIGKSSDAEWLLIDIDGGRWVKRQAIEVLESLALVPVREPTPVPEPTATNTPDPSPSPTETPTVNPTDPDLSPTDALLVGARKIRVTVHNAGGDFSGALTITVDVQEVGSDVVNSKQVVFDVQIPSQEALAIDFELSEAIIAKSAVRVKLEVPVHEQRSDNNITTFVVTPEEATPTPPPSPSPSPSPAPSSSASPAATQ